MESTPQVEQQAIGILQEIIHKLDAKNGAAGALHGANSPQQQLVEIGIIKSNVDTVRRFVPRYTPDTQKIVNELIIEIEAALNDLERK